MEVQALKERARRIWDKGDCVGSVFGAMIAPRPEKVAAAARSEEWGDEAVVRERFAGLAGPVDFERWTLTWTAPSPEALEVELGETAPTFAAAREGLSRDAFAQLRGATLELIKRHNLASEGTLRIDAEYLISVARKRG